MIQTTQEPLPSATIEINDEVSNRDFASMNGAKSSDKTTDSIQQEENPAPEEIVTTRTVSQSPILKGGVIAFISLLFVMIIGTLLGNSINVLKFSSSNVQPPKKEAQITPVEPENETGKDKTALALTSQNYELKQIRDQKTTPTPTPTPTSSPASIAPVTAPMPLVRQVRQTYPVASQPPAPRTFPQVRRERPQARQILREHPQAQTRNPPRSQQSSQPTQLAPKLDPTQQWLLAANAGSFSSTTDEPESEKQPKTMGIEGGIGGAIPVSQTSLTNYNAHSVLIGSTAEGRLETPIAWGVGDSGGQNYLVKISKSLKASDGSEVLPVGSYLVVQLSESNGSGIAKLHGVSALVNIDGNMQEKPLPPNAVLVMAKDGNFLKANSRKGSNLGNNFISAIVSGVAKAAEVQNRATSQTSTNSNGFSTTSTTNDQKDLSAAFGEGAFNSILDNIKSSNVSRSQQLSGRDEVFVIDVGKPVGIFVNQTISL